MCTNPDLPWLSAEGLPQEGYDFPVLVERIKRLKKQISSSDAIILTGGEPTLQPRFLDVLKFIRDNFPKQEIRILTNGRKFIYSDFAKEVLKTDNLNIAVSLYGPNARIHDSITRAKGSFDQTIKGIANILSLKNNGQIIEIRTVISRLSYQHLGQILNLIKERFSSVDRVILIFMEVEGQADKNFRGVGITYSQVRPFLEKLYPVFNNFKELRLYHFPLCALEPKFWPFVWRTLPTKEVAFNLSCRQCNYKKHCLGIHKGYLEKMGDKEFGPIKEEIKIKKKADFYHPIIEIKK
jgi:MoaA/NifB/PqqE/SkfB family radical SAM enzyme